MVEIVINQDGSVTIPKGTREENQVLMALLCGVADDVDEVSSFLDINKSEKIFGDEFLCG